MFDPWKATVEEAREAQNGSVEGPDSPLFQFIGAQQINEKREQVEKGCGFTVLYCIRICVTNGLVAPEWLAYAFNRRYDAVKEGLAISWDDSKSFGKPYKKNTNKTALRKRRLLTFQAWNKASEIIEAEPDTPIDSSFFERVGKSIRPPVGKTSAEKAYYRAKKLFGRL